MILVIQRMDRPGGHISRRSANWRQHTARNASGSEGDNGQSLPGKLRLVGRRVRFGSMVGCTSVHTIDDESLSDPACTGRPNFYSPTKCSVDI